MRARPFIAANEPPRPYSEILSERRAEDPRALRTEAILRDVARLEGEAADAANPAERKRLQCEAEALRAMIHDNTRRS